MKNIQNNKIVSIELIRVFACVLVVFSHTQFGNGIGATAINYFFIISGFVNMLSTEKSCNHFWKKRLLKIIPLYYLVTCITSVLIIFIPALFNSYEFSVKFLIKSLLFIPYEHNGIRQPILGVGWTLNFEMFFYLIFWIGMKINYKWRGYIAITFCVMLSALGYEFGRNLPMPLSFWLNSYLLEFGFGILAFYISRKFNERNKTKKNILLIWGTELLLSIFVLENIRTFLIFHSMMFWEGAISGAVCLLIILQAIRYSEQIIIPNAIMSIATCSYLIYLIHIYPIRLFDKMIMYIWGGENGGVMTALSVIITIGICVCLSKMFERFISRKERG